MAVSYRTRTLTNNASYLDAPISHRFPAGVGADPPEVHPRLGADGGPGSRRRRAILPAMAPRLRRERNQAPREDARASRYAAPTRPVLHEPGDFRRGRLDENPG